MQLGDAEIQHLNIAAAKSYRLEPDVFRFEVAVQNSQPMRFVNRRAGLAENIQRVSERQRTFVFELGGQRDALQVFHHQIGQRLLVLARNAEVGYIDDIRMSQPPYGLGLTPETFDEFAVAR